MGEGEAVDEQSCVGDEEEAAEQKTRANADERQTATVGVEQDGQTEPKQQNGVAEGGDGGEPVEENAISHLVGAGGWGLGAGEI